MRCHDWLLSALSGRGRHTHGRLARRVPAGRRAARSGPLPRSRPARSRSAARYAPEPTGRGTAFRTLHRTGLTNAGRPVAPACRQRPELCPVNDPLPDSSQGICVARRPDRRRPVSTSGVVSGQAAAVAGCVGDGTGGDALGGEGVGPGGRRGGDRDGDVLLRAGVALGVIGVWVCQQRQMIRLQARPRVRSARWWLWPRARALA
jgi:hypothetical protein